MDRKIKRKDKKKDKKNDKEEEMDCGFGKEIGLEEEALCLRKAELSDLEAVAELEAECFPKAEAATKEQFQERLKAYSSHFLLLFYEGKLISFINGFVSNQEDLSDEMYENVSLHEEEGDWQMIFGVNTHPKFQRRGIATKMMQAFLEEAKKEGRKGAVLTCKEEKIPFYSRCGFILEGKSASVHGDAKWYQMRCCF